MAKVTMQDVAQASGVSRITVWKVLTGRPGVSDGVRMLVQQKADEMGYHGEHAAVPQGRKRTFSVVVARPESSSFWMQIIHCMAEELAQNGVSMLYTYVPTAYREGFTLPTSLESGQVDGFLVLNVYDERLLRMLSALDTPKIFLDTVPTLKPEELHGDLVLLEGRSRVREITRRMLESGRKRLGFIGDIGYAQTNFDRFLGFQDAHSELGIAPEARLSLTSHLELHGHYEAISRFLDGLEEIPDGFVCASDFIASFVSRYFHETGRSVPDCFVLCGFDNSREYPGVAEKITTADVETSVLGKRLARMLMFRADYPDSPQEVAYVATRILYRGPLAEEAEKGID